MRKRKLSASFAVEPRGDQTLTRRVVDKPDPTRLGLSRASVSRSTETIARFHDRFVGPVVVCNGVLIFLVLY